MGVRPAASAALTFLLAISSVSPQNWRRSEWAIITDLHPASTSIPVDTSPVHAPSASQCTFCAAMEIAVPRTASTEAASAVNGGATIISQCTLCCTSGANAEKNAHASLCVLYIFQFPAITGRRMSRLFCVLAVED